MATRQQASKREFGVVLALGLRPRAVFTIVYLESMMLALVGLAIGMVIALPLSLIMLTPILGIMEVLSPCMISGMLGGMWGGMSPLAGGAILQLGVGTGLAVVVVIYALNAVVSGPQKVEN